MTLAPDVSDDDFRGWLAAADIVVDLRFPHRGEVSGSLARAMQAGRPPIVSATGTYLDVPDDAVLRVAAGPPDPAELATRCCAPLVDDPGLRARMGAAARAHVEAQRDVGGHGARLRGAPSTRRSALIRDPAHKALAIWGKALADMGAGRGAIWRRGLGLGYARALSKTSNERHRLASRSARSRRC